eukprot:1160623-Pelagomonas_calceolata.AAC.13
MVHAGMTSRTSFKQRRKKPKHLGGFLGMLTVDKPGRVRGPMWTTNTIAQIYQDKTIHVRGERMHLHSCVACSAMPRLEDDA